MEILFNKDGYNAEYNIYKSHYHASKSVKNSVVIHEDDFNLYEDHYVIKTIYVYYCPYYEVVQLRRSIVAKGDPRYNHLRHSV